MIFFSEQLEDYVTAHSQQEPGLLRELNRETHQKILAPRMLSGHFQGRLLSVLSKLVNPKTILEIGTYTGYATLCLAEGLQKNGIIHTIDYNEELLAIQQKYFIKSEYGSKIKQYTGNALDVIPTIADRFDLVFLDADKANYINYFNLIIDKMNKGGLILADNVLWSGKVLKKPEKGDEDTKILIAFNKMVNENPRVETILLPIRDGLTICRVK
ncbi:MAG: methyltransferase [Flavobacteriales bacterium]|nr:MAG: methyltransferase [Flavobacteriales bacterium]